ncbi:MAG TPA: sulfotransferase [Haliangiales bacterium]|nr:sulfotransferase [Haliangiales bacterium]
MNPAQAPIFVIGTGRSGTTLLRLMLSAHPRIYVAHEASFYVMEFLYPRRAPRRAFLDYYFQSSAFRWLRVDPARVLAGLPDPLPRERMPEAYAAIMREKAAQYGRVRFGDKTPAHAAHLKRIYRDFPDARVIHIVRDPRNTVPSLSRMPWASASLAVNAFFCDMERRQVAPYRDRLLQIRLEDLLGDARTTMARVLDFVGEPWDDAVLDHARHLPDANDMPPLPWLESAARDRTEPPAPGSGLTPLEIRMIERINRRTMKEHGYAPVPLDHAPGRLAVWWAGVSQIPALVRFIYCFARLSRNARDPRHFHSPETNALWRKVNPPSWGRYPGFDIPDPPALPAPRPTS